MLRNIDRYLKNFKKDLDKLQKYQYNITYGSDYLFNELNEKDYYKPTEVKSAFDGSYILYESKGDKDNKLALYEYFDIIRPYLKDMIDDYKSKGEWKIQSDNVEIMNGTDTSDAINKLINSFMKRYQEGRTRDKNEGKQLYI